MINLLERNELKQHLTPLLDSVTILFVALVVVAIILVSTMLDITEAVGRTLNLDLKNSTATNNALLVITIFLVISAITALL